MTTDALCRLTTAFAPDLAKSLCAKLEVAAAAQARGNAKAAENQIGAFVNEVLAQSGKKISADNAEVLIRLGRRL